MLSKPHFEGACEASWQHAMRLSLELADNDITILTYCKIYFAIEELCYFENGDIDDEPYFTIRQYCVNKLKEYYENAGKYYKKII